MIVFASAVAKHPAFVNIDGENVSTKYFSPALWGVIILFTVVFGVRYDIGTDHLHYLGRYLDGSFRYNTKWETLFLYITSMCYRLNLHPAVLFSFFCFLQITFFVLYFKNDRYILPLIILFMFGEGFIFSWFNIIRQSIALCIWVYALRFVESRKLWPYILLCFVAMGFHRSAVVLLLFYPFLRKGRDWFKNITIQVILFIITFVIKYSFADVLIMFDGIMERYGEIIGGTEDYYRSYTIDRVILEMERESTGTGLAYIFKNIIYFIIIIQSQRLKDYYNTKRFIIIYNLFFLGLLFVNIMPANAISISRPFKYLFVFQPIMLAYFTYFLANEKKKWGRVIATAIAIAFVGIFVINHIMSSEYNHLWYLTTIFHHV